MQVDELQWEKSRLETENARLRDEKPDIASLSAGSRAE